MRIIIETSVMSTITDRIVGSIFQPSFSVRTALRSGLLSIVIFIFMRAFLKYVKDRRMYNRMPHIPSTFVLGNILGHLEYFWNSRTHLPVTVFFGNLGLGITKFFHQNNHGLLYFRLGPFRNIVLLVKARTAEVLLSSTKHILKSSEYSFIQPWLGQGLLTGQGRHWKTHRKLLTPTFHFEILEKFLPTMNAKIKIMLELIERKFDKKSGIAHITDIRPYITNCTVDIICETAMGIKMSGQEEWCLHQEGETEINVTPGSKYAAAVRSFLEIVLQRLVTPWMHSNMIFNMSSLGKLMKQNVLDMHSFTNDVIRARKAELESRYDSTLTIEENFLNMTKNKRLAFLDLMLGYHFKDPKEMDLVSIREEVDTFMFGGHDTTSTTLHFAFLLIGLNIDKQRKIQDEMDELFCGDYERDITLEDTKKMTYLDMAVREVMRLYPPAAFFARHIAEPLEMDGYVVPSGTTIAVFSYALHRDPELYDKPEYYLPERFEPNSKICKNPFGYVPFSAGSRNCIGQRFAMLELKLVMASVLRKYNIKTLTKQELIQVDISIITKSNTPIEVQFTERDIKV